MGQLFELPEDVFVRCELPDEPLIPAMEVPPDIRNMLLRRKPHEDMLFERKIPPGIMGSLRYLVQLLFPFLFLFSFSASERSWVDFPRACCPLFVGEARMRIRSRSDARIREGSGRRKKKGREVPRTREGRRVCFLFGFLHRHVICQFGVSLEVVVDGCSEKKDQVILLLSDHGIKRIQTSPWNSARMIGQGR